MMMINQRFVHSVVNTAIDDIDILEFFHGHCWIEFRKKGIADKIPDNI